MKFRYAKHNMTLEYFIEREVIYCASHLVSELCKTIDDSHEYSEDLLSVMAQPDYEQALLEDGWDQTFDDTDGETWINFKQHLTGFGTAQEVCEQFNIDYEYTEALEHWIVSNYLADLLEAQGEMICRDLFGLTIWGRTTSGQSISMDSVIEDVCSALDDNHYLVSMAKEEEKKYH